VLLLISAALVGGAPADEADPPELRETLPGGSQLGDAPELPRAEVDVLPRPTRLRIQVQRRAPPPDED
jgi:hypothetical protein